MNALGGGIKNFKFHENPTFVAGSEGNIVFNGECTFFPSFAACMSSLNKFNNNLDLNFDILFRDNQIILAFYHCAHHSFCMIFR